MVRSNDYLSWIDVWKGILIALVVFGHVLGGAYHYATGTPRTFFEFLYKLIYSFHMPAFFFLAGMVWKATQKSYGNYVVGKFKRLLVPYIVFGVLSVVLYELMSGTVMQVFSGASEAVYGMKGKEPWWQPFLSLLHAGGWPNGAGFQANSVLWFLPCMFSLLLVYPWIDRLLKKKLWQILLAVVCLIEGVVANRYHWPLVPWGFSLVPYYMFFFICGRLFDWKTLANRIINAKCAVYVAIAGLIMLCALCYVLPNQWYGTWWVHWRLAFAAIALFGIFVSAIFALAFPTCRWLEVLGSYSLVIMLLHKLIVLGLQYKVPLIGRAYASGLCTSLSCILAVSAVAIFGSVAVGAVLRKFIPWAIGERG